MTTREDVTAEKDETKEPTPHDSGDLSETLPETKDFGVSQQGHHQAELEGALASNKDTETKASRASSDEARDITSNEKPVAAMDEQLEEGSKGNAPSAPAQTALEPEAGARTFGDMGLDASLIESVNKLGWSKPTPIQSLCLPHSLVGKDVAGFAQTGTGKNRGIPLDLGPSLLEKDR